MKIGSLVVEFLSDTSGFKKGNEEVNAGLDKTEKSMGETAAATTALSSDLLLLAGSATAAGVAVYASIEKYGAMSAELKDLSLQTGATTEKVQQMKYAALISNTEFSKVTFGVNNLALAMSNAKDSTSAQAKAFRALGVDPSGKTPAEVFDEVTEAIMGVKDETARAELANAMYGRSWKELIPYMETYIEKRDEIKKAPVFSQKELDDLAEAKVRMDKFTNSLTIYGGKALSVLEQIDKYNPVQNLLKGLSGETTGATGGLDIGSPRTTTPMSGGGIDPFAGLTEKQAEIKNLTDYTIPALQTKLDEMKKSGTAKEIADASLALIQAKENLAKLLSEKSDDERNRIEALTNSYKEYQNQLKSTKEAKQSLADLEDETYADLQNAGTDVASARAVMQAYNKSRASTLKKYASNVLDIEMATTSFNQIASGVDLSNVSGTSEYDTAQAQAKAAAGGITITGDIYLNGDKSFENYLNQQRQAAGILNR